MASVTSASSWGLLDSREEDELHRSRLLNVEEKAFKRVTKRLGSLHGLATSQARRALSPPDSSTVQDGPPPVELAQMKEDVTLDFAAFDSSIARLQFLLTANEHERERYMAQRQRIVDTARTVRQRTLELRDKLEAAREKLAQGRRFDELADRITNNPALRSRDEQAVNLRKLGDEIAELEAERTNYDATWSERRDQFARIMDESMRLRRLIRDEKEEVERREGMDDEAGTGEGEVDGIQTPRPDLASGNATPMPDTGTVMAKGSTEMGDAADTPHPASTPGGHTSARLSPVPSQDGLLSLKPRPDASRTFGSERSRSRSRALSRKPSSRRESNTTGANDTGADEDVEMSEEGKDHVLDSPLVLPAAPGTPNTIAVAHEHGQDSMDTT